MKKISRTKFISLMAVLTALNIVGNFLVSKVPKVPGYGTPSLIYLLACVTGFALGPLYSPIAMALGDAIPAILFPNGIFNPMIVISNAWLGFITGFIYRKLKFSFTVRHVIAFIAIPLLFTYTTNILAFVFHYMVLSGGKSPSGFKSFIASKGANRNFATIYSFLVIKRVPQLFWIVVNGVITYPVLLRLKKVFPHIFVEKNKHINDDASNKEESIINPKEELLDNQKPKLKKNNKEVVIDNAKNLS